MAGKWTKRTIVNILTTLAGFNVTLLASCTSTPEDSIPELLLLDAAYAPEYTIGGAIQNMFGSQASLENAITPSILSFHESRSETFSLDDGKDGNGGGSFTFASPIYTDESYSVSITNHPRSPTELCSVSNESGTVENDSVTGVQVACEGAYRIVTSVSGLSGSGLVLESSSGDSIQVSADGTVEFPTPFVINTGYSASITGNPGNPWQTCTFSDGSTSVSGSTSEQNDLHIASISCETNEYGVSASISGLVNSGLYLSLNGTDVEIPAGSTTYTLGNVSSGSSYTVALSTNAVGQECEVLGGSGVMGSSALSVTVSCVQNGYMVGGSLSGYSGSGLQVTTTGSNPETKTIEAGSTGWYFDTTYNHSNTYSISIATQPTDPWQYCTVTQNQSGTITESSGSMSTADISCSMESYNLSGSISGLTYDGLVLSLNGSSVSVSGGSTSVDFGSLESGTDYTISIVSQPSYQSCTVSSGTGTVEGADISSISVSCSYLSYNVGGSVSGLVNSDTVTITDGTYGSVTVSNGSGQTFYTLEHNSVYSLSASASGYTCSITGGSGGSGDGTVFGADVSDIAVVCSADSYAFTGEVKNLVNSDTVTISSGTGSSTTLAIGTSQPLFNLTHGTDYTITASASGYTCGVTGGENGDGTGRVDVSAVSDIVVDCSPSSYTYNGSVSGITVGTDVVNFDIDVEGVTGSYSVTGGGAATGVAVTHGDDYTVSVTSFPAGYSTCAVTGGQNGDGTGRVDGADPTAFVITCTPNTYTLNLNVSDTGSHLTSGTNQLVSTGTIATTFDTAGGGTASVNLSYGSSYAIALDTSDLNYSTCTVSGSLSGSVVTNPTDVDVSCSLTYSQMGVIATYTGSQSSVALDGLQIQDNGTTGGSTVSITGTVSSGASVNGDMGSVQSANTYNLKITSQPTQGDLVCAFEEKQSGSPVAATSQFHVDCVDGYLSGQGVNGVPGGRLDYRLYKGDVTTPVSSVGATLSGIASFNGNLYLAESGGTAIHICPTDGSACSSIVTSEEADFLVTDGTSLYYSAKSGSTVYKMDLSGNEQASYTSSDGVGSGTAGLALDQDNQVLYVAATTSQAIQKIDLTTGTVSDLSSGGDLNDPTGLVLLGDQLYTTNPSSQNVVQVDTSSGTTTVIANTTSTSGFRDGDCTGAWFSSPEGITTDGTDLYLVESGGYRIRKIDLKNSVVSTVAGDGTNSATDGIGILAQLSAPAHLSMDGRNLYVVDPAGSVRKVADSGLVGYWPLNAGASDLASDVTTRMDGTMGDGSTATTYPTLNSSSGRFGTDGAYKFDGGDYITADASNLPDGTDSRTACVWIKPSSLPSGGTEAIFAYGSTAADGNASGIVLVHDASTDQHMVEFTGWNDSLDVYYTVSTTEWTHLCGTFDGSTAILYINGKIMGSSSVSWSTSTGSTLQIGRHVDGSSAFTGAIADLRIYNRLLNDGEINELARSATASQVGGRMATGATGLLSYYSFEGVTDGGGASDLGALGHSLNDGTGTPATTGKAGDTNGAYEFSGSNYMKASSVSGLPMGKHPRTLCAWIKPASYPSSGGWAVFTGYGAKSNSKANSLGLYNNLGTIEIQYMGWGYLAGQNLTASYTPPLRSWTHVCGTYDSDQLATVYVNGKVLGSTSMYDWDTTGSFSLSVGSQIGTQEYFEGDVDEVRVYNNALNGEQIRQLSSQIPTGLVASYDFSDNSSYEGDSSLYDASGWGGSASLSGGTQESDRFGNASTSVRFDAANGVTVSSDNPFNGLRNGTLSFWMRVDDPYVENIFMNHKSSAGEDYLAYQTYGTTSQLYVDNGHNSAYTSFVPVDFRHWQNVTFVKTVNNMQVYLNGFNISSNTINNTAIYPLGDLVIGDSLNGSIDDILVYNRVLSDSEILTLVRQPNKMIGYTTETFYGDMIRASDLSTAVGTGVAAADYWCQDEFGSDYKAMIVDGTSRVACTSDDCAIYGMKQNVDWVLRPGITYTRTDGVTDVFTANSLSVWDFGGTNPTGGNFLASVTDVGTSNSIWTGLDSGATWKTSTGTCSNWTDGSSGTSGSYGDANSNGSGSIYAGTNTCNQDYQLYCIQQ